MLRAETLLNEARHKDLDERATNLSKQWPRNAWLSAAASQAELGALKETQLRYAEAATSYRRAVELAESIPKGSEAILAAYLNNMDRSLVASRGLRQRRAVLPAGPGDLGARHWGPTRRRSPSSLNNLADTLSRPRAAMPRPSHTSSGPWPILKQVLGPDHPQVAPCLGNYAMLFRATNRIPEADELEIRAKTNSSQICSEISWATRRPDQRAYPSKPTILHPCKLSIMYFI